MKSSSSIIGSASGLDKSFCMVAFLPSSLSSLENMLSAASPDAASKTNILVNVNNDTEIFFGHEGIHMQRTIGY